MVDILLHKLTESLGSSLSGNRFSYALYSYLKESGEIPNDSLIRGFIKSSPTPVVDIEPEKTVERDMRFRSLSFRGIRKFPSENNKFFKISFVPEELSSKQAGNQSEQQGAPCSVIFMGHNGVGKTTIFHCLEKVSLGSLHSVLYKNVGTYNETLYLQNFLTPIDCVSIILETQTELINLNKLAANNPRITPACFCSNSDVARLLQNGITPDFISEQLGLSKYSTLLKSLKNIENEFDENLNDFNDLKKEIEHNDAIINIAEALSGLEKDPKEANDFLPFKAWAREKKRFYSAPKRMQKMECIRKWEKIITSFIKCFPKEKTRLISNVLYHDEIQAQIKKLKNSSDDEIFKVFENVNGIMDKFQSSLNSVLTFSDTTGVTFVADLEPFVNGLKSRQNTGKERVIKIGNIHPILTAEESMIADFYTTYKYLQDEYIKFLEALKKQSETIFSKLLSRYFEQDIQSCSLEVNKDTESIIVWITPRNPRDARPSNKPYLPQLYLNTFRFKVFCVALKVSLAIYSQQLHHINFPIIIDDVFDSSDFTNKEKIQEFVEYIFNVHEEIFKEKYKSTQLSLPPLQFIFFTQDDVIADSVYRAIKLGKVQTSVKLSRIFNYTEATKEDEKSNANDTFIKIEDIIDQINW